MQRKTPIFILFSFLFSSIYAQENTSHTLLENTEWKHVGFMISPNFGYTQIDHANAFLMNFRSGVVLKDKFSFGGFFNFSINDVIPKSETIPGIYLDYKTFGGFFEYTIYSKNSVHATFPLLIGGGEIEMDGDESEVNLGEAHFFLLEPGVLLEINIHKYVRFNIGVKYRWIGNVNYRNLSQSDVSGLMGQVGLKIGLFRK